MGDWSHFGAGLHDDWHNFLHAFRYSYVRKPDGFHSLQFFSGYSPNHGKWMDMPISSD
jgi:hypothetical protein